MLKYNCIRDNRIMQLFSAYDKTVLDANVCRRRLYPSLQTKW